jgi:cytochrome P450
MASIGQLRELPAISGIPVTRELLARGLRADGPIVRDPRDLSHWRLGRREVFVIRHPDLVDHVLHDAVDRYHKSLEYELLRSVLGLNLFTDEDESWRRHRMLLNPVMAKRHVAGMCELMIDPIATFVDELDRRGDRAELEMGSEMTALTLDVVGAALFGHGFGQLAREMRRVVTSGLHAAERAERLVMVLGPPAWLIRACAGAVHHSPVVPPPLNRIQWVMRTVDRCVWELIDDRRAHPTDTGELLNLLLSAEDEHGRLPLRRVRDEVTTFMLAGHETTANAMAWMWYLLALHADHRERLL